MLPLAAMLAELRSLASADTAQPLRVGQLDNVPLDASSSFGEIFANKIVLKCPRNAIGLKSQIESCFQFIESNVENRFVDPCNYRFSPLSGSRRWFSTSGHPGSRQVDSLTETVTSSTSPTVSVCGFNC